MRLFWIRNKAGLLITWTTISSFVFLATFLFTIVPATVRAEDGGEITSQGSKNHIEHYGELFDATVTIYPEKPLVGPVHFTVRLFRPGTTSVLEGARIQLTVISPTKDAFKAWAVADPAFPGEYHANLSMNEPGYWTADLVIHADGIDESTLDFSLIIGDRPLGVGTIGTFVWMAIIIAFLSGSVYLWRLSRTANV